MQVRKKGRAIWLAARESGSNRDFHFLKHLLSRGGQPQLGFIEREEGDHLTSYRFPLMRSALNSGVSMA
jgi:hypothetical protein